MARYLPQLYARYTVHGALFIDTTTLHLFATTPYACMCVYLVSTDTDMDMVEIQRRVHKMIAQQHSIRIDSIVLFSFVVVVVVDFDWNSMSNM